MNQPKLLIVNADDFGFTHDVNRGIVEAHTQGILTSTTLMANGAAFEDAVRLARENPSLDIGCHLMLIGGFSLVPPYSALPSSIPALLQTLALRKLRIYEELAAQVRRIQAVGIKPTHLDTHKHTHFLPAVLEAVARIAQEFNIRWVRRPFQIPFFRDQFQREFRRRGCRTTDHFAGFRLTGRFGPRELIDFIRRLPEGTTEFMCHPGRCSDELHAAPTRLKESRERELKALIAPEARAALERSNVRLVNFRDL